MKSQATDYLRTMEAIYEDACHHCVAKVSFRDLLTIRSRVEEQGLSFLTIALPAFCADFEKSLQAGYIDSKCFRYFRKHRAIPAFLRDMLSRVFDQETGRINDEIDSIPPPLLIRTIASIRQVCLAFKKIELPCTPKRTRKAVGSFVDIERSFDAFQVSEEDQKNFELVSSVLWDNMLHTIRMDMFVPRHGPGATAERISGNSKYAWHIWHDRLEPYFPLVGSGYPDTIGELDNQFKELESVNFVHSDREQPVRVTPVPKTLKGPRIIAIEPCCMQYAQQGIRQVLYDLIESHWRTKGHINFRDQSINQSFAMRASTNGQLATIDLSDASDRVPHDLAMVMFRSNPDLRDAIDSCRSTRAELPDGTVIGPLRKFASMGSALCFPIEAMYFYTICVMALLKENGLPVSHASCNIASRDVWVYGDDIIVPAHAATTVLNYLLKYNCKVNDRKTFFNGSFRESCGVDAFLGEEVTPLYLGTAPPKNRQQSAEVLSWVSTARSFYTRGFQRTSRLMFYQVECAIGPMPFVPDGSPVIGRNDSRLYNPPRRWNAEYQDWEIKSWTSAPVYRTDELDGYAALMKCLLRLESRPKRVEPYQKLTRLRNGKEFPWEDLVSPDDPLHLKRSALHGAVANQRHWVSESLTRN